MQQTIVITLIVTISLFAINLERPILCFVALVAASFAELVFSHFLTISSTESARNFLHWNNLWFQANTDNWL